MKIGPLLRTAVRLVQGIQIQQTDGKFHLTVVSIIKFLKVNVHYLKLSAFISHRSRRCIPCLERPVNGEEEISDEARMILL